MPVFRNGINIDLNLLTPDQRAQYKREKAAFDKASGALDLAFSRHELFMQAYPTVRMATLNLSEVKSVEEAWRVVDTIIAQAPVIPKGLEQISAVYHMKQCLRKYTKKA